MCAAPVHFAKQTGPELVTLDLILGPRPAATHSTRQPLKYRRESDSGTTLRTAPSLPLPSNTLAFSKALTHSLTTVGSSSSITLTQEEAFKATALSWWKGAVWLIHPRRKVSPLEGNKPGSICDSKSLRINSRDKSLRLDRAQLIRAQVNRSLFFLLQK